jgi:sugar lactone lactonase YvrE
MIHDERRCELGEGAFWHPVRKQFFWFDILNRQLLSQDPTGPRVWVFDRMVSAAGWVDRDRILIATDTGLIEFDLETGRSFPVTPIEADRPETRSNDGKTDRQGGFWIGTMGRRGGADVGMGAIWRWYRGTLRKVIGDLTIPNATCFAPDGRTAYYADTVTGRVMRLPLDAEGWPDAAAEVHLDLSAEGLRPDGATVAADGTLWLAQWGAGRVAAYDPRGTFLRAVETQGAPNSSCPAFGGADLGTLFVTTAQEHLSPEDRRRHPHSGMTFAFPHVASGLPEPKVAL